jgi:hypothetical protein
MKLILTLLFLSVVLSAQTKKSSEHRYFIVKDNLSPKVELNNEKNIEPVWEEKLIIIREREDGRYFIIEDELTPQSNWEEEIIYIQNKSLNEPKDKRQENIETLMLIEALEDDK